jgi:hypothetical protein
LIISQLDRDYYAILRQAEWTKPKDNPDGPCSYIEIRSLRLNRAVTNVVLIDRATKHADSVRKSYLMQRRMWLESLALVELDLQRGGRPVVATVETHDYCVVVQRGESSNVGLWPIRLHEPLPKIPIPLHWSDADVELDLQAALNRVYDASGYSRYIYTAKPVPPLSDADAQWAESLIPVGHN